MSQKNSSNFFCQSVHYSNRKSNYYKTRPQKLNLSPFLSFMSQVPQVVALIYHMLPVMTCCPNIGLKARVKQLSTEPPQTWKTSYINCTGAENADDGWSAYLACRKPWFYQYCIHCMPVIQTLTGRRRMRSSRSASAT